jgi:arylsulfatase/uncharacterized sulfatase
MSSFAAQRSASSLGYHTDYETLGLKGSFNSINPGFTSAAVGPLSYYKFYAGEGGLRVPLIISGLPLGKTVAQTQAFSWATDIASTILVMAGVSQPEGRFGGKPVLPMTGKDLLPLVRGEKDQVYGNDEFVGYELTGHGVLFQGDFKLVVNQPPLGDGEWRLFNIVIDPAETNDLKALMPERFEQMMAAYEQFALENKVQELPQGYSGRGQLVLNLIRDRAGLNAIVFILLLLVLTPFAVYLSSIRGRKVTE